jgi:hypothetical protein
MLIGHRCIACLQKGWKHDPEHFAYDYQFDSLSLISVQPFLLISR